MTTAPSLSPQWSPQEPAGSSERRPRVVLIATITVVAVATVLLTVAAVVALRHDDGPSLTYGSAEAMAAKSGCAGTFVAATAAAGTTSAGNCTINDHEVLFRVLPSADAALAWTDGARAVSEEPLGYTGVGEGWVVFSQDLDASNAASIALTTE